MANYIFGDVDEIVCQHILGEFRFNPKSNESFTIDRGGIRANDDANQVTSNGQMMSQLNRVRWSVEGSIAVDIVNDKELSEIGNLSKHPELGVWTISMTNGAVYKGKGRPVGDIQTDTNAGTMTLKISGGGELEKI